MLKGDLAMDLKLSGMVFHGFQEAIEKEKEKRKKNEGKTKWIKAK